MARILVAEDDDGVRAFVTRALAHLGHEVVEAEDGGLAAEASATAGEIATRLSPLTLSFMGESRRLDNRRLKRELRVPLRYPTIAAGLLAASSATAG